MEAQLQPDEVVVARGRGATVSDWRILFVWRRRPPASGWTHDGILFDEITRWSIGRRHDGRPMVRIDHPPHERLEWVPAHNILWFHWGNAERAVPHRDTSLSFSRKTDPLFHAVCERPQASGIDEGEPFTILPPGTRQQRMAGSHAVLEAWRHVRWWQRRTRRSRR